MYCISLQNDDQNTEGSHFITYVGGREALLLSLRTDHRLQALSEQCLCCFIMRNFKNCRSDLMLCQWLLWVGHVVMMGKTDAYRILGSKSFGISTWQVRRRLIDSMNLIASRKTPL
jgi:hypothetical protein